MQQINTGAARKEIIKLRWFNLSFMKQHERFLKGKKKIIKCAQNNNYSCISKTQILCDVLVNTHCSARCLACLWRDRKLSEFIKNIFICFLKMNKSLTDIECHEESSRYDSNVHSCAPGLTYPA